MLPPLPRCSRWAYSSLKLAHPYQPSPKPLSGRPAHRPFRGLLGVYSRCGLHTRAVTKTVTVIRRLQTFRLLHACSGCFRLERSPGGACTRWKSAALSRRTWYGVDLARRKLLPLSFDDAVVARWQALAEAALGILDAHLADCLFLAGAKPTIADIASYADIAFARLSGRNLAEWPNVGAWAGRIEALPGFAAPFDLLAMHDAEIAP